MNKYRKAKTRTHNEKFISNLSNKVLNDDEVSLLSKGLKFIPTPNMPASNMPLIRDFNKFARLMRLKYVFCKLENYETASVPC